MEFDINKLVSGMRTILDWMLENQHADKIKEDLSRYQQSKQELTSVSYPESVLKLLVETKITNSYYRNLSGLKKKNFDSDFSDFFVKHGRNISAQQTTDDLATLIITHSVFPQDKQKVKTWAGQILQYPSLSEFSDELYRLRKKGKNGLLRDKGADHYLRNVGYWDIVPIDIHEKRFLVRTGIYHGFSVTGRQDPLDNRSLSDALSRFCSLYLKGKTVEGIDLSCAPGIVDLFIWSFCSDERYIICGSTPRCNECGLKDACLFGITNIQKAIAQGRTVSDKLGLSDKEVEQVLGQSYGLKGVRQKKVKWEDIAEWIKADPGASVQAMKQSGFNRVTSQRYLEKAGLSPVDVEKVLRKVFIAEAEREGE